MAMKFGKKTQEAIDTLNEFGISKFKEHELKALAVPLIRESKRRIRELEKEGLTDSPAYRYYKKHGIEFTANKNVSYQKLRKNIWAAYQFLNRKTSSAEGAKEFLNATVNKWVGENTTKEQREKIWDLYHRLEAEHPNYFNKESYSSGELAADIYTLEEVLSAKDFDIDSAYELLTDQTIIFDDDADYELMDELADWFTRKS